MEMLLVLNKNGPSIRRQKRVKGLIYCFVLCFADIGC